MVNGPVRSGAAAGSLRLAPRRGTEQLRRTSVESIVLEVPHDHPQLRPGARTGVWCATKLATDAGGWRQINRAGHPMMWPIFWPDDVKFDNPANTRHPSQDAEADGGYIAELIAAVVEASGTSDDPRGYGEAVARVLFPDVLPYVVGTPASYGFAGFNGRTLADNAPEVMLSLVTGTAVPSGLTPSVSAHLRDRTFPYVVPAATSPGPIALRQPPGAARARVPPPRPDGPLSDRARHGRPVHPRPASSTGRSAGGWGRWPGSSASLHILGWGTLIAIIVPAHLRVGGTAFGLGIGVTAYVLGLRHAFDADHIAAIDNTTRRLMHRGERPTSVGFWFSLGHSTVVFALALVIALGARALPHQLVNGHSGVHSLLVLIGTTVSVLFLVPHRIAQHQRVRRELASLSAVARR